MNKNVRLIDFNSTNNKNKKYKIKAIYNRAIYTKKLVDYLSGLILQKNYLEKKNTEEPASVI